MCVCVWEEIEGGGGAGGETEGNRDRETDMEAGTPTEHPTSKSDDHNHANSVMS